MRTGDWILCCTVLASLAGLALLGRWFRTHRDEEAGVPACTCEDRDDEPAFVRVDPTDRRAVAAMFGEYAREMVDLRVFAREVEDLYVIEVQQ